MSNLNQMIEARAKFERACADQNARRNAEVAEARSAGGACEIVDMMAFGGVPFCRTHRVMGPCPFAKPVERTCDRERFNDPCDCCERS